MALCWDVDQLLLEFADFPPGLIGVFLEDPARKNRIRNLIRKKGAYQSLFVDACREGLLWTAQQICENFPVGFSEEVCEAASLGNVETLEWVFDELQMLFPMLRCLKAACVAGNVETARWIAENRPIVPAVYEWAQESNDYETVEWAITIYTMNGLEINFPRDIDHNVKFGRMNAARAIVDASNSKTSVFLECLSQSKLEGAKYLLDLCKLDQFLLSNFEEDVLVSAIESRSVFVLNFVFDKFSFDSHPLRCKATQTCMWILSDMLTVKIQNRDEEKKKVTDVLEMLRQEFGLCSCWTCSCIQTRLRDMFSVHHSDIKI